MKKLLFALLLSAVPCFATISRGKVVNAPSGCDYFVVETATGYDLLEWYGGPIPDVGDTIVGNFEEYGFHNVRDVSQSETIHVWVEDYWLDKEEAFEQLLENCE